MPMAKELGILDEARRAFFDDKTRDAGAWALGAAFREPVAVRSGVPRPTGQPGRTTAQWFQLLAFPDIGIDDLRSLCPEAGDVSEDALEQLEIEALYATYVERQERDAQSLARDEAQAIPDTLDYDDLTGLSAELRGKLSRIRPRTLAQAGRIDGMTPAALALILTRIRRDQRKSA
jgi:tRNA uridine 5-carboxymethylaminomethyl modification enzyme